MPFLRYHTFSKRPYQKRVCPSLSLGPLFQGFVEYHFQLLQYDESQIWSCRRTSDRGCLLFLELTTPGVTYYVRQQGSFSASHVACGVQISTFLNATSAFPHSMYFPCGQHVGRTPLPPSPCLKLESSCLHLHTHAAENPMWVGDMLLCCEPAKTTEKNRTCATVELSDCLSESWAKKRPSPYILWRFLTRKAWFLQTAISSQSNQRMQLPTFSGVCIFLNTCQAISHNMVLSSGLLLNMIPNRCLPLQNCIILNQSHVQSWTAPCPTYTSAWATNGHDLSWAILGYWACQEEYIYIPVQVQLNNSCMSWILNLGSGPSALQSSLHPDQPQSLSDKSILSKQQALEHVSSQRQTFNSSEAPVVVPSIITLYIYYILYLCLWR